MSVYGYYGNYGYSLRVSELPGPGPAAGGITPDPPSAPSIPAPTLFFLHAHFFSFSW